VQSRQLINFKIGIIPDAMKPHTNLTLGQLEQAINHWREQQPAIGWEKRLSPEVATLAQVYAHMIMQRVDRVNLADWPQAAALLEPHSLQNGQS
jgi:hypothetical protein